MRSGTTTVRSIPRGSVLTLMPPGDQGFAMAEARSSTRNRALACAWPDFRPSRSANLDESFAGSDAFLALHEKGSATEPSVKDSSVPGGTAAGGERGALLGFTRAVADLHFSLHASLRKYIFSEM